jgi:CRP-like cAMP-binding protein
MSHVISEPIRNQLLQALSYDDWHRLAPLLTRIPITMRQTFETAGKPIESVYFIEHGLASVVATLPNGHCNEVGLFGFDGMTGSAIILGDTQSPFNCFAQMDGTALQISAKRFSEALHESPSLKGFLEAFVRSLAIQTACTALANGQSHVDQRLARWLLMVHDRVMGDVFSITHEYLSIMLGVRRTGVTDGMHMLEGKHLIVSTRNKVVIKDRAGLIELSGGSYGTAEREYTRITGLNLAKSEASPMMPLLAA